MDKKAVLSTSVLMAGTAVNAGHLIKDLRHNRLKSVIEEQANIIQKTKRNKHKHIALALLGGAGAGVAGHKALSKNAIDKTSLYKEAIFREAYIHE